MKYPVTVLEKKCILGNVIKKNVKYLEHYLTSPCDDVVYRHFSRSIFPSHSRNLLLTVSYEKQICVDRKVSSGILVQIIFQRAYLKCLSLLELKSNYSAGRDVTKEKPRVKKKE